eukprot:3311909-Pleurochrysis_carterae.AAC.1
MESVACARTRHWAPHNRSEWTRPCASAYAPTGFACGERLRAQRGVGESARSRARALARARACALARVGVLVTPCAGVCMHVCACARLH